LEFISLLNFQLNYKSKFPLHPTLLSHTTPTVIIHLSMLSHRVGKVARPRVEPLPPPPHPPPTLTLNMDRCLKIKVYEQEIALRFEKMTVFKRDLFIIYLL